MSMAGAFSGYGDDDAKVVAFPQTTRFLWPDPSKVPPREWLMGTVLLRRNITVVVAPGGVGKTAWTVAAVLSLLTGRPLLGMNVHAPCNVLCCNLEDGPDEFTRRVLAAALQFGLAPRDMTGQLHTIDGRSDRLIMASLGTDNATVVHPHEDAMTAFLAANQIGLVVVDPFVNSHELDENSNPHVNAAARSWARAAEAAGAAVLLVHHTRKGAVPGDMEASRGATALVFAARVGLVLSPMQTEDAQKFGIEADERSRFIRLDDGKRNLAPAAEAAWYRLESVPLGNATPEYPHGDNIQACVPWSAPPAAGSATMPDVVAVLDLIADGPGEGELYAPTARGRDADRWVGSVVMEMLGFDKPRAIRLVKVWTDAGLLLPTEYRSPSQRKVRTGTRVHPGKLAEMRAGTWSAPVTE